MRKHWTYLSLSVLLAAALALSGCATTETATDTAQQAQTAVQTASIDANATYVQVQSIQDGTITNAKIGEYISSINYSPGVSGWRLDKVGTFEINGNVEGGGRLTITNQLVSVYTPGGSLKLRLGIW